MAQSSSAGIVGIQDLGGVKLLDEILPPSTREEPFQQWELEVCAVAVLLGKVGLKIVDEHRRTIETLPGASYARLRYYEKWCCASAVLCLEKGLFTEAELEAELGADEGAEMTFEVGESVVVKSESKKIRWRKPHIRCPGYVHGKTGVVVRRQGPYEIPESLAVDQLKPKHKFAFLYTVRFKQVDLWNHYSESNDTLDTDIYSHWLEKEIDGQTPGVFPGKGWGSSVGGSLGSTAYHAPHAGYVAEKTELETAAIEREGSESPYASLHRATVRLCDAKGIFKAEDVRRAAELLDEFAYGQTMEAARLVARAWIDDDFKTRLLAFPKQAIEADFPDIHETIQKRGGIGSTRTFSKINGGHSHGDTDLVVVPNTDSVHNVVVCTLCSCYPRALLGLPPRYYTSRSYRARVVCEPRAVLKDFGCELPQTVTTVRVHDSTADVRFMVLPQRPSGSDSLSESELARIATRDCLVGLALPKVGRTTSGEI